MLSRDDSTLPRFGSTAENLTLQIHSPGVLRIAVIGAGRWGQNLLRVLSALPRARLVAACDLEPRKLETLPGTVRRETDASAIFASPDVDAVVIATTPMNHATLALRALAAQKDVFVEKPMAMALDDAVNVRDLARRNGRRVMVGFVLQHHVATRVLSRLIEEGALGDLLRVYARRGGGRRPIAEHPAWWSLAPHDVSLALSFFDAPAERITASRSQARAGETVVSSIEHADGNLVNIELCEEAGQRSRRVVVLGSRKVAVFDDLEAIHKLKLYRTPQRIPDRLIDLDASILRQSPELPSLGLSEPLAVEVAHFVDSLLTKTPFHVGIDHALDVIAILAAGEESMLANGQPVRVADWRSVGQLSSPSSLRP